MRHEEKASLEPRFSEAQIREAVVRIAARIASDYAERRPVFVGILKGAFVFLADLVREAGIPCEIDFVRARSYGKGTRSAGTVEITKEIETDLEGRDIIIVEDIADTGLTLDIVRQLAEARGATSVRSCALVVREGAPKPDYWGLVAPPGFVVGYGIDHAERHRELRDIRAVRDD